MGKRSWHDAEIAFQRAVEADPNSVRAHRRLSMAIALQMSAGPVTSPENRTLLARILVEQQRALELAPEDPEVLSQLARTQEAVCRASQDPEEQAQALGLAVKNLRASIKLKPDDPNLPFRLANLELYAVGRALVKSRIGTQNQDLSVRTRDELVRRSLASQWNPALDDSLAQLGKVIKMQPENGFAMLLSSISYVFRAGLASSDSDSEQDRQIANQWEARFRIQWGRNYSPDAERRLLGALLNPQIRIFDEPGIGILGGVPPPSAISSPGSSKRTAN